MVLAKRRHPQQVSILSQFGSTDGIQFDHYETDWNFE